MYIVLYFENGGYFRADSVSEITRLIKDFDSPIERVVIKNEDGEEFIVFC